MSLDVCSTHELKERLDYLIEEIKNKLISIGPTVEEVARMRKECSVITNELKERGEIVKTAE